jgi:hypothetical protein
VNQKVWQVHLPTGSDRVTQILTLLPGETIDKIVIINDHRAIVVVNQPEEEE